MTKNHSVAHAGLVIFDLFRKTLLSRGGMLVGLSALLVLSVFAFDLSQRSELQKVSSSEGLDNFLTGSSAIFPLICPPIISFTYAIRSLFILLAAASLLAGLVYSSGKPITAGKVIQESGFVWKFSILAMLSVTCFLCYYFSPKTFWMLCQEDGLIETGSALLVLTAAACFAVVAYQSISRSHWNAVWFLAFSAGCFLVCMEEISWGQRIIGFEKPDFIPNAQNEFNLHNMATNACQFAYLNFSAVAFVFLPALMIIGTNSPAQRARFSAVPSTKLLVIGMFTFGVNDDFWNLISTQLGFYFGVVFLLLMLQASLREKSYAQAALFSAIAMATVGIQFGLWLDGEFLFQIREVRELAIALMLFFFATECVASFKSSRNETTRESTELVEIEPRFNKEAEIAGAKS